MRHIEESKPYMSLDDLEALTPLQRTKLIENNPEFPPTMFMIQEEKEEFFRRKAE
jgi:hypothetical protein